MFTKAGILSIEHADFEGVERLALVLGAEITSTFDHPELVRLGECKLIEEVVIGEDKLIRFSGVLLLYVFINFYIIFFNVSISFSRLN
jgi:T-complex protein 1 subunit beta